MADTAGDDAELTDGLVGVEVYEAPAPAKKSFYPWHRPRKQFVRVEQWCYQIGRLLDEGAQLTLDAGTLRYCGLPGTDLIDLRCFHDSICVPRSLKLRFLGFNSAVAPNSPDQVELNISRDEIAKLDWIDPISDVISDDIRTVANVESMAHSKMSMFGPFDVVNLDLCDSFGAEEAGLFNDTYYNAVAQLMAIQARQKTPWLMLLTTRVGNEHVHAETLARFQKKYTENLAQCPEFKKESAAKFSIGDEAALTAALSTATGLHRVFLVGICKWLLGMAIGHDSTIEVRSVLGYRVVENAPATDLVSLAIKVTPHPTPAEDPLHLASAQKVEIDECLFSVRALRRVAKHVDVDEVLAGNDDIRRTMTENMSQLLEAARYDTAAYADWLSGLSN
jgi:hypothetical protein